ncbi:MAG TPA: hypothetical protein VLH37_02505 [Bacteroidales bacterium]|nr:hypothetical protein [Bacteroidales bacterium]
MSYTIRNLANLKSLSAFLVIMQFLLASNKSFSFESNSDTTYKSLPDIHRFYVGITYSNYPSFVQPATFDYGTGFASHFLYSMDFGLWAEARLYHNPGMSPFVSVIDFSAGYNHIFSNTFDAGVAVTRFLNNMNPQDPYLTNATMLNFNLGVDWKILYTNIIPGWMWDEDPTFFIAVQNSRFIKSATFGKNNSYFTANPGFYILWGHEVWQRQLSPLFLEALRRRQLTHLIPDLSRMEEPFGLQSLFISLPITLESRPWSFELEPSLVVGLNKDAVLGQPEGFFLNLGVFLKIF